MSRTPDTIGCGQTRRLEGDHADDQTLSWCGLVVLTVLVVCGLNRNSPPCHRSVTGGTTAGDRLPHHAPLLLLLASSLPHVPVHLFLWMRRPPPPPEQALAPPARSLLHLAPLLLLLSSSVYSLPEALISPSLDEQDAAGTGTSRRTSRQSTPRPDLPVFLAPPPRLASPAGRLPVPAG